jgi:hypothetical protein
MVLDADIGFDKFAFALDTCFAFCFWVWRK